MMYCSYLFNCMVVKQRYGGKRRGLGLLGIMKIDSVPNTRIRAHAMRMDMDSSDILNKSRIVGLLKGYMWGECMTD